MMISIRLAAKYLFPKSKINVINIITVISVLGIAIGTASLLLVLSVFNGFENLLTSMFSEFNPDVKIEAKFGKVFKVSDEEIAQIKKLDGVAYVSKTLEEVAIFNYGDIFDFGKIKGVDKNFEAVSNIDTTIKEGIFRLKKYQKNTVVVGYGMREKLGININDLNSPLAISVVRRDKSKFLEKDFIRKFAQPVGTFSIQQEVDQQYVLAPLSLVREILEYENEISALEIKILKNTDFAILSQKIQSILGDKVVIKDRYLQDEAFLNVMKMEKWMAFSIICLVLILVIFNMVGTNWMIVYDKRKDIAILKSMGANEIEIKNTFLFLGILLTIIGILLGLIIAVILYFLQINYGLISFSDAFIIDSYPISMRFSDGIIVFVTVLIIGTLASIPAALKSKNSGLVNLLKN